MSALLSLPTELHFEIVGNFDPNDVKTLSALHRSCLYFKNLLDASLSSQGLIRAHLAKDTATHTNLVKQFIKAGGNVNQCTTESGINTALSSSAPKCRWMWNIQSNGETALHFAIHKCNAAAVKLLLEAGSKTDLVPKCCGRLPVNDTVVLWYACLWDAELGYFVDKCFGEHIMELLVRHGADINMRSCGVLSLKHCTMTALHLAIIREDLTITKFLINNGADLNAKTAQGVPALTLAAYKDYAILKLLLQRGADVNVDSAAGHRFLDIIMLMPMKYRQLLKSFRAQ